MRRYLLRRLAESVVTFILVTIVVFLGVRALPGDPARALAGEESNPEVLTEIRRSFGLDQLSRDTDKSLPEIIFVDIAKLAAEFAQHSV